MASQQDTLVKFVHTCEQGAQLFAEKNAQYGNTIYKTGVLGAVVELIGVVARLPQMVLHSSDHGRATKEKLKDIFLDIHNYASIALIMLEGDNWEGEQ